MVIDTYVHRKRLFIGSIKIFTDDNYLKDLMKITQLNYITQKYNEKHNVTRIRYPGCETFQNT